MSFMDKASNIDTITPEQAEDALKWVMRQTRAVFLKVLSGAFNATGNPDFTPDLEKTTLRGFCGFAQSFIDLTLNDYHIGVSKPYALQSLPNPFDHVGLCVEIDTTEGKKAYLIDPTFRQFCGTSDGPGEILRNMPDGEWMTRALREEGFFELTSSRASTYLSAFNGGINPFSTEERAITFFADPPDSEMNRWFPRDYFQERGYLPSVSADVISRGCR
jgi:hypothetical protein